MSDPPRSLCGQLQKYHEEKEEDLGYPWATPSASLAQIAECGCQYCLAAWYSIGEQCGMEVNTERNYFNANFGNSSLVYDNSSSSQPSRLVPNVSIKASLSSSGLVFSARDVSKEIFVLNENDDPIIPVSVPVSAYTGSDESLQTAMRWLEECITGHHSLCPAPNSSMGPTRLPFRVLEVGHSAMQRIRLVQTNNERGYYSCLSYCWGGEQPLKTTLKPDTLTAYQQEIQWEQLPKTFQDAILVTRKFGISYLWIDSLCIIQDDSKDWEIQSAQMAAIYENSIITIAGSASPGPTQGIFRKVDPDHFDHDISSIRGPHSLGKMRIRKPLSHKATELPLLKRAWAFQERLLSPRYLHFGQNELLWECMERLACECGNLEFGRLERRKWLERKNRLHPLTLQHFTIDRNRTIASAWQAAVVDYTRMQLSYPSDIFPAISGVAKSVASALNWTYIAGLWKENLVIDLLWRGDNHQTLRRCDPWRAPTFSWASVTPKETGGSGINYSAMEVLERSFRETDPPDCRLDEYVTVVDIHCKPFGDDPTGRLISGYIVFQGTLIRSTLRNTVLEKTVKRFLHWDIAPFGKEYLEDSSLHADYDYHDPTSQLCDGDTVYCLKLIGYSWIPAHANGELLYYLVLRKVKRGGETVEGEEKYEEYERIGLMTDARGAETLNLVELSEEEDIQRDVLVKII